MPLDGAVLAPRAVQQREDDVDLAERLRRLRRLVHDQVGAAGLAQQRDRRRGRRRRSGSSSGPVIASRSGSPDSSTQRPSVAMPIGTTSYAVAVDRVEHAAGGDAGDRVLAGAAAEDDGDAGLAGLTGCSLIGRPYRGRGARRPPRRTLAAMTDAAPGPPPPSPSPPGRPPHEPDQPLNAPITMASTYVAGGDLEYGRYGNPTWAAFEEALGALEGGRCLAFASGLAAVATVLDLVGQGATVVAPRHAYNGTVMQLADLEARGRLTARLVDITDTDAVVDGLRRRRAGLARVADQPGPRGRRHRDRSPRPRTRPAPTSSSTTPSPPRCSSGR